MGGVACFVCFFFFFFQAEDGIRGGQESRGLGGVYKGQAPLHVGTVTNQGFFFFFFFFPFSFTPLPLPTIRLFCFCGVRGAVKQKKKKTKTISFWISAHRDHIV